MIELELEEAPENNENVDNRLTPILVGPMPTEFESKAQVNSTYPHGFPGSPGAVVVRAEEALIVVFVLILWVAAIALFFNRWGKIRMLEPYQPKFQQQHRASCAPVDPVPLSLRACSKFNIHCLEHPLYPSGEDQRPRQNSVIVGSSVSLLHENRNAPRRAKSAFDLQTLVVAECDVGETTNDNNDEPTIPEHVDFPQCGTVHGTCGRRLKPFNEYPKPSRSFQRERGASVCNFDRTDVLARPLQRERGMSICQFDRTDVLARPLQRDRGMSVCHFDRTDVLAHPMAHRGSRASVFSNAEKLENVGRSFQRESRNNFFFNFNAFVDKQQFGHCDNYQRSGYRDSRLNVSNADRGDNFGKFLERDGRASLGNNERQMTDIFSRNLGVGQSVGSIGSNGRERGNNVCPYDRPSCSKTPDLVIDYKATCV